LRCLRWGSGLGGLEWQVVGPTLYSHLSQLDIPVELFAPFGTSHDEFKPTHFQHSLLEERQTPNFKQIGPDWVALLRVLEELENQAYPPRIGRTQFQKLAYFATVSGLQLGLHYSRSNYGPFAPELKQHVTHLLNNGLIEEVRRGQMFEVQLGKTFDAAKRAFPTELDRHELQIHRLVDLFARMRTRDAEIAATVHFVAAQLYDKKSRPPSEHEIVDSVLRWKQRRDPPFDRAAVSEAVRGLNILGWIQARPSDDLQADPEVQLLHG
jgi:uncharacterized protein YwgA